jgi:hypothetical protein
MNVICSADFGRRYATRDAFGVFTPALKRGPMLKCRYRGKTKPAIGKALGWKRGPTFDCRYCGKATLIPRKVLNWKRAPTLDCRYRGRSGSGRWKRSVAMLTGEIQCFNQREGFVHVRCAWVHYARAYFAWGEQLSALADYERSPAIYRRVWLENERLVA